MDPHDKYAGYTPAYVAQYVMRNDVEREQRCEAWQSIADSWVVDVRQFGREINDITLEKFPDYVTIRRGYRVHSFAVWTLIMEWGGEEIVSEHKLWKSAGDNLDPFMPSSTRGTQLKTAWYKYGFTMLTGRTLDEAGIDQPPMNEAHFKRRYHSILRDWPTCIREDPEAMQQRRESMNASASNSGRMSTRRAAPLKPPLPDSSSLTPRRRGRPPQNGSRGSAAKRPRGTFESDASSTGFDEGGDEAEDSRGAMTDGDHMSMEALPSKDRGKKRHSETQDHRDAEPSLQQRPLEAGPISSTAGKVPEVATADLPSKWRPNCGLPEGAIRTEFTASLRFGTCCAKLNEPFIHTALVAKKEAYQLMREALVARQRSCRAERFKVQFVSAAVNFLGGWFDARLEDGRTGSLFEGAMRFLVSEHYPGDTTDEMPMTWLPLVYYGPKEYPFQTPQVMLRVSPPWKPAKRFRPGDIVEVQDDSDEEETNYWMGAVHSGTETSEQVTIRLYTNPYGNGGIPTDDGPDTSFLDCKASRVALTHPDDLRGIVREPAAPNHDLVPAGPDFFLQPGAAPVAISTTDDLDEQVMLETECTVATGEERILVDMHASARLLPPLVMSKVSAGHDKEVQAVGRLFQRLMSSRGPSAAGAAEAAPQAPPQPQRQDRSSCDLATVDFGHDVHVSARRPDASAVDLASGYGAATGRDGDLTGVQRPPLSSGLQSRHSSGAPPAAPSHAAGGPYHPAHASAGAMVAPGRGSGWADVHTGFPTMRGATMLKGPGLALGSEAHMASAYDAAAVHGHAGAQAMRPTPSNVCDAHRHEGPFGGATNSALPQVHGSVAPRLAQTAASSGHLSHMLR